MKVIDKGKSGEGYGCWEERSFSNADIFSDFDKGGFGGGRSAYSGLLRRNRGGASQSSMCV